MKVYSGQRIRSSILLGLLILTMGGLVAAQTPGTGAVSGQVFDPSGALIPNARVTLVNEATDLSRTATTTSEGLFRLPLLPPGNYSLTVESEHFQPRTLQSIHVTVTETAVVDVTLAVRRRPQRRSKCLQRLSWRKPKPRLLDASPTSIRLFPCLWPIAIFPRFWL